MSVGRGKNTFVGKAARPIIKENIKEVSRAAKSTDRAMRTHEPRSGWTWDFNVLSHSISIGTFGVIINR